MITISNNTIILGGYTFVCPSAAGPFELNVYGRMKEGQEPEVGYRYIEYSFNNFSNFFTSPLLTKTSADDPVYDLIYSTTSYKSNIWLQPGFDGNLAGMLGDTISLTGAVGDDYPYYYDIARYDYVTLNGISIPSSGTTNLYFELAQF